jgi:antitoxin YefM
MQTVSYTDARNSLATLIERAERDREPIAITRHGEATVILLSAQEYAAMAETLHLMSTPANAQRLRKGLRDIAAGKARPGELCD